MATERDRERGRESEKEAEKGERKGRIGMFPMSTSAKE